MSKTASIYEQAGSNYVMVRRAITVNAVVANGTVDITTLPAGFILTEFSYYLPALGTDTDITVGWSEGLDIGAASAGGVDADPNGLLASVDTESVVTANPGLILAALSLGSLDDRVTLQLKNVGGTTSTASALVCHFFIGGFNSADGADYLEV